MMDYPEIDSSLAHLYLEDSFVLNITATPGQVVFGMEFVLLPGHELYSPPADGEQYCYRRGSLVFSSVRSISWTGQGVPPAIDPVDGSQDFGNIDSLRPADSAYALGGDWGEMQIISPLVPTATFDATNS